jgi:hypothetical protein
MLTWADTELEPDAFGAGGAEGRDACFPQRDGDAR